MGEGGWPKVSIEDTCRILTGPGAPFEMEEKEVRGRRVRVYRNARLLSPYEAPVRIWVRDEEFPRNAGGKTFKPQLREEMLARLAPA